MTTEFNVTLENRPGTLAELGEALGRAGVNVEALQAVVMDGEGRLRFVTGDTEAAQQALLLGGFRYSKREVLVVHVLNEPGTLGDVARVMAEAGVNIESVYVTVGGNVVLSVDDLPGALQVASGMAVTI